MTREAHIPLVLWISAAIVAHMAGGGGAHEVAEVVKERAELRALTRQVREQLHPADTTFEVLTETAIPTPTENVAPPENAPENDGTDATKADDPDKTVKPPPTATPVAPLPEPPKTAMPPPPPQVPPPPQAAPPPPVLPKPAPEAPAPIVKAPPPPPPPEMDHRIAIKQNVKKDQEDNPNANRIADDANHTEEETVARIRSHDQDDSNPTPGTHRGPKGEPGNSDHDKIAHSEDKKGDEAHAPGEAKPSATAAEHDHAAPPSANGAHDPPKGGSNARGAGPKVAAVTPPSGAPSPGGAGPTSPETMSGDRGSYSLDPVNPGGDGKSRRAGKKRFASGFDTPVHPSATGFNKGGPFNLPSDAFEKAVGQDRLRAERAADGAARRSAHRGAWETNKFERWRPAIENYEPSVKTGNQTALNAARVPFATYINSIHNRLHPIFADEFLAALEGLPKTHPLQSMNLVTHVEIVLSKDQGRIVRMGVTRASGVTAFDVVALSSINRAQPFGKAPDAIVSPDGNVYLHWEFHRDPFDACTTRNARPFILKEAPPKAPEPLAPPKRPETGAPADDRPPGPVPALPLR